MCPFRPKLGAEGHKKSLWLKMTTGFELKKARKTAVGACSKTTWEGSGKPMKDHVSLQERLKDLRVEKGLKLEELAEKTGIS